MADAPTSAPTDAPPKVDTTPAADTNGSDKPAIVPKPVEVNSVPETPVNNAQTPAGGTPRPELKTAEADDDKVKDTENGTKEKDEAEPVMTPAVRNDGATATTTDAPPATNGKRKAEDEPVEENDTAKPPTNGNEAETTAAAAATTENKQEKDDKPPEKKAKVTDQIAEKVSEVKDKVESKIGGGGGANGGANGNSKPARAKKEKPPPAVGRTERKTRSQGPAQ